MSQEGNSAAAERLRERQRAREPCRCPRIARSQDQYVFSMTNERRKKLSSIDLKLLVSILFSTFERMKRFTTIMTSQNDSEKGRNPIEFTAYAKREISKTCCMMELSASSRTPTILRSKCMKCWGSINLYV